MKLGILFAGAAAFAFAGPALAKPGNGHGHGQGQGHGKMYGYGVAGCPPGLAKKAIPCIPPGQAKKMYNVGQRYNRNFGTLWTYNQIPDYLRSQYAFDPSDRYYYGNGYLYQVDPRTLLVQQVISALIR